VALTLGHKNLKCYLAVNCLHEVEQQGDNSDVTVVHRNVQRALASL